MSLKGCWADYAFFSSKCIGVNRPNLGGTVLNSATVSCRPALLAYNPNFTKLLAATVCTGMHNHLIPIHFATPTAIRYATIRTVTSRWCHAKHAPRIGQK